MKVTFATNASFLIHLASGKKILTDPWYSDGIYYGSWYNYPPLSAAQRNQFLSCSPDYIYISHLHPDHLDVDVLDTFSKTTVILIGKLPHPHLLRSIQRLGFKFIDELPLDEEVRIADFDVCVFSQFEGTSDGTPDDVNYPMDTSLFVRDSSGCTLFHAVDNPIKPRDAHLLARRFGTIDLAILPYSGASSYPHAFPALSHEVKQQQRDTVKKSKLQALHDLAKALSPRWIVPAAGSYVMGGRLAAYTQYLHQATQGEMEAYWTTTGNLEDRLLALAPGDSVHLPEARIERDPDRTFDHFSAEDRLGYALSLEKRPLPQDSVHVPSAFALPWRRLLEKARRNLWASQRRLDLFPEVDVELVLKPSQGVSARSGAEEHFCFALDRVDAYPGQAPSPGGGEDVRPRIVFTIDASLMLMVLLGAAIWNNVEIAALVECERHPETYTPAVHSLMSFLVL